MGAMAEAVVAYAQPLIDKTDGSMEQMQNALSLSQACWNLSLLSDETREKAIANMQSTLQMGDVEFEEFRRTVVLPMIQRHHEMFPGLHRPRRMERSFDSAPPAPTNKPAKKDRYAPCSCGSGQKYRFCCGRTG